MNHSIVIPLYNKQHFIRETLASLQAQTRAPHEIIIVDDASTDCSLDVVEQYLDEHTEWQEQVPIDIIRLKKNHGPGYARNIGFERTTGDLVSFLDADDSYDPECLQQVNHQMRTEKIDFLVLGIQMLPGGDIYPDLFSLQEELVPLPGQLYRLPDPLRAATSPHFIMGVGSNVVVRRKWLEPVRYATGVWLNEGIDYWYRVLRNMVRHEDTQAALLMGGLLQVREVPGSLSRQTYNHWRTIELPLSIRRYKGSKDPYDKRLMRTIGERWFTYAMDNLSSRRQKFLFLLHHAQFMGGYMRQKLR